MQLIQKHSRTILLSAAATTLFALFVRGIMGDSKPPEEKLTKDTKDRVRKSYSYDIDEEGEAPKVRPVLLKSKEQGREKKQKQREKPAEEREQREQREQRDQREQRELPKQKQRESYQKERLKDQTRWAFEQRYNQEEDEEEPRPRIPVRRGYLSDMLIDSKEESLQRIAKEERKNGDQLFFTVFGSLAAQDDD